LVRAGRFNTNVEFKLLSEMEILGYVQQVFRTNEVFPINKQFSIAELSGMCDDKSFKEVKECMEG
jgi:hypothetical protein